MSKFGIICEFNPLHNGHEYLIKRSEELGATNVVCIMSGNFTQRGEFPITDKYSRAEMAIKGGADLVLELPFPWCGASAEYFASAAVSIAASFCQSLQRIFVSARNFQPNIPILSQTVKALLLLLRPVLKKEE